MSHNPNVNRAVVLYITEYAIKLGSVNAGLILSQIVYWHLADKSGKNTKLRIEKDGRSFSPSRVPSFMQSVG